MPLIKRYAIEGPARSEDPIQFALGDEVFTCLDEVPAAASYALVVGGLVVATLDYIRGVLVAEDEDRFDELLRRKDVVVTQSVLSEVLTDLVAVYTARPTRRPANSVGGPQPTSTESPGSSLSEAGASR